MRLVFPDFPSLIFVPLSTGSFGLCNNTRRFVSLRIVFQLKEWEVKGSKRQS